MKLSSNVQKEQSSTLMRKMYVSIVFALFFSFFFISSFFFPNRIRFQISFVMQNTNYEFVKIGKSTCFVVAGYSYNITFLAKDCKADVEARAQTFQAKVWHRFSGDVSVSFCRLKPAPS